MNRFLTSVFILILQLSASAQTTPNEQLRQVFAPLDKSLATTGYLVNQQFSFVEPGLFQGKASDTIRADINTFGILFGAMSNSRIINGGGLLMPYPSYLDSVRNHKSVETIPIALMTWQYDRIVPELAIEHNLLTFANDQFFDVPNRPISPYFVCSLFTAAPIHRNLNTLSPKFSLPGTLWYNNLENTTPTMSLDAGDGQGWRPISKQSLASAKYDTPGEKTLTLRLVYPNRTVFTKMKITVTRPLVEDRDWASTADESIPISATKPYLGKLGTGTMQVYYNCDQKKMLKPLIIVEGIEFLFPESGFNITATAADFFDRLGDDEVSSPTLRKIIEPEGYDIIYVDWSAEGGADYIQRNAYMIEEVIKWVNAQKAAAGSTEPNVVLGISMGGLVAKYALLDMQNNGLVHDTRLFISFDSPLRGANIPIGAQCALDYLSDLNNISITVNPPGPGGPVTLAIPAVPQIAEGIAAIQAPATRQILLYHVNNINGSVEPVNTDKVAFFTELDAMGTLTMRHVAISNGADNGSAIENNMFAGISFFTLIGSFTPCFPVTIPNFFPPPIGGTTITVCPNVANMTLNVRATGNNVGTNVFNGGFTLAGGGIEVTPLNRSITCFTKPYDVCPGGNSILGTLPLGLAVNLIPNVPGLMLSGGLSSAASGTTHHTFIPTFSGLSAVEPSNLLTPAVCGAANRCSASDPADKIINPFSGLPEFNQSHVTIDRRIATVLVDELVTQTANPYPLPVAPSVLNTYYNAGYANQKTITDLVISTSSGKLSINNTGNIGYNNGPASNLMNLDVYTRCGDIVVNNQAKLFVGADNASKHGKLVVTSGSSLTIKSGGTLRVTSSSSSVVIKPGARLILDPGAIIQLDDPSSAIRIEGELVVNGDIVFSGQGYFDFAGKPQQLVMGPGYETFNLTGFSKTQEMIRLSSDVKVPEGKHLNWNRGLILVSGSLLVGTKSNVTGVDLTVTSKGNGLFMMGTGVKNIFFNGCDFTKLEQVFRIEGGQTMTIDNSNFEELNIGIENYKVSSLLLNNDIFRRYNSAVQCQDGFSSIVNNSSFYGSEQAGAISFSGIPFTMLDGCMIEGHKSSSLSAPLTSPQLAVSSAAVKSFSGIMIVSNTSILNNGIGIKSLGSPGEGLRASAIVLLGSNIAQNEAGVFIEGASMTDGLVLADCSSFWLNREAIIGSDITLMIDALDLSVYEFDTDVPNLFVHDAFGAAPGNFIDVCYIIKPVTVNDPMRNNFWASYGNALTQIDPLPRINLRDFTCVNPATTAVIQPVANKTAFCPQVERPEVYGHNDPERNCTTGLIDNEGTNKTVNWQFHKGYHFLRSDSVEYGIEEMRPVADLWQSDMNSFGKNCQKYIATARAIVDGFDAGMGLDLGYRPSERTFKSRMPELNQLLVVPNPASEYFSVQLPDDQDYTINIVDAQGRVVLQRHSVNSQTVVSVVNWSAGLYHVVARNARNGTVWTSKMVVGK
jgi:Secretion system C-terminal sorting domain